MAQYASERSDFSGWGQSGGWENDWNNGECGYSKGAGEDGISSLTDNTMGRSSFKRPCPKKKRLYTVCGPPNKRLALVTKSKKGKSKKGKSKKGKSKKGK